MQLRTNYDAMSNEELINELDVRSNTFGDNLSTYTTGAERAIYKGREVYFGEFDDNNQTFTLYTPKGYVDMDNVYATIAPKNASYRDLIIQFLKSPFLIIGADSVSIECEVDQAEYLKDLDPLIV